MTDGYHVLVHPAGFARLLRGRDDEILIGPGPELSIFARWLNEDLPADDEALRRRLREMIQVTRGCSFANGIALRGRAP